MSTPGHQQPGEPPDGATPQSATPGRVDADSRRLPRAFWFVWSGTLINRLCYFVEPFLALYLVHHLHFSIATIGGVIAGFGAGSLCSQPLGGYLADRVGRRATLVFGMTATAAAFMWLVSARGLGLVIAAACVAGLAIDLYRPAVAALVADIVPAGNRVRAFGLLYWAINLGVAVAGVLGGLLASHSYFLLFLLDAATCLGFAVLLATCVQERPAAPPSPNEHSGYTVVLRDGLLVALSAANLAIALVYMQSFVTLPLVMRADGLGPTAYGVAYAVNPAVVILLQPIAIKWLARLPRQNVLAGSAVLTGAGFGSYAFAHSLVGYVGGVILWTIGEIGESVVGPALVADIAPVDQRGRYNGVFGLSFGAAALLGPLLGTELLAHVGRVALWGSCFAAGVLTAGSVMGLRGPIDRRLSETSPPGAPIGT